MNYVQQLRNLRKSLVLTIANNINQSEVHELEQPILLDGETNQLMSLEWVSDGEVLIKVDDPFGNDMEMDLNELVIEDLAVIANVICLADELFI